MGITETRGAWVNDPDRWAENLIDATVWSDYRILGAGADADGGAGVVGPTLSNLLQAKNSEDAEKFYWQLENRVFVQGAVYSAAEPVTAVLMAALAGGPSKAVRVLVLQALYFILRGRPAVVEFEAGNADLIDRCRKLVYEGFGLLVSELDGDLGPMALDTLEQLADPRVEQLRKTSAAGEPNSWEDLPDDLKSRLERLSRVSPYAPQPEWADLVESDRRVMAAADAMLAQGDARDRMSRILREPGSRTYGFIALTMAPQALVDECAAEIFEWTIWELGRSVHCIPALRRVSPKWFSDELPTVLNRLIAKELASRTADDEIFMRAANVLRLAGYPHHVETVMVTARQFAGNLHFDDFLHDQDDWANYLRGGGDNG